MTIADQIKLNRKFGYTIALFLLAVAGYHFFFKHKHDWVIGLIALVLLALSLVKPVLLTPLRLFWDKLGHLLGTINTFVLLSLFYMLVLTPFGLMMRLLNKDILKLKRNNTPGTYWELSPQNEDSKMENQF